MIRIIVLAAAVASLGGFPNPNPHAIRDAKDAIATAQAILSSQFPQSGVEKEDWQRIFTATLNNGVWLIKEESPTNSGGVRGTYINLDAKDGHIISAKIVD